MNKRDEEKMGSGTVSPSIFTYDNLGKVIFVTIAITCLAFVVIMYVRQSRLRADEEAEEKRSLLLENERLRDKLDDAIMLSTALETTIARRNERIRQLEAQIPSVEDLE